MNDAETIISQTKSWISNVVVGCNFCPFAGRELRRNTIAYEVVDVAGKKDCLEQLFNGFQKMDMDSSVETMFLILPIGFDNFLDYLQLVEMGEKLLKQQGYEGVYQLASFHPLYLFAGSYSGDAANYTNRSPYPMLHILREASVTRAIEQYPHADNIPEKNIAYARAKGLAYMEALKNKSMIPGEE